MKIGNAYSGYCLKCNKLVEKNKGYLKLKNLMKLEIKKGKTIQENEVYYVIIVINK